MDADECTATANNGTITQAITLASSARFQTAYARRRTGSGAVYMSMDGASGTFTDISPLLGSTILLPIPIATQTLANPAPTFKFAISGDAIDVDLVQNEAGTEATSPIPTTHSAVTRAADNWEIALSALPFNAAAGRIVATYTKDSAAALSVVWQLDGGTTAERIFMRAGGSAGAVLSRLDVRVASASQAALADAPTSPVSSVIVADVVWGANDFRLSTGAGAATPDTSGSVPAVTTLRNNASGTAQLAGHLRALTYYPVP